MKPFATFDNPLCEIWQGDCRRIIEHNMYVAGNWLGAFDFIFADPPFNIGQKYDVHSDKMNIESFKQFTSEWLYLCIDMLRDGGIFVVHMPDDMAMPTMHSISSAQYKIGSDMQRIDWIIWHYRFAVNQSLDTARGFLSSKCHALVYRKGSAPHTFNAHDIAVESDRATKYNDKRIDETANGGNRVPLDVWDEFPRIQGNNGEKVWGHPNQLPEKYIERFIRAYTNVGDFCFDPFGGTGTTAVVARELQRNVATCELSKAYCVDIRNRVTRGAVRL